MRIYAAEIAQRLQRGREDEDMSKDDNEATWRDGVSQAIDLLHATIANSPVGEDESAGRVAELERLVDLTERERDTWREKFVELKRQLDEQERELDMATQQLTDARNELVIELDAAYVAREVPWSDVAAGMMTIARDGTPWMVETWIGVGAVRLRNAEKTFEKAVDRSTDETVRVLVPYVTPEQAEALVVSELGGRA